MRVLLLCLAFFAIAARADTTDGVTCQMFCDLVGTACTGTLQQYPSTAACLSLCSTWPGGTAGTVTAPVDTVVNSLGCRYYHALVSNSSAALASAHCYHTSNQGGGQCGTTCQAYCNIMVNGNCATLAPTFGSFAECELSFCKNYISSDQVVSASYALPTGGNSAECRLYHAEVGQYTPDAGHCTHAQPLSVVGTCTPPGATGKIEGYCQQHIKRCNTTGTNSAYGQWSSAAECLANMAAFPEGPTNDTTGNTLACRNYHAGVAGGPLTRDHCWHSGLNGLGQCGTQCQSYCRAITYTCTGTNLQYPSEAACLAWCNSVIPTDGVQTPSSTSGDSIQCRIYHVTVAGTSSALADVHCIHAGPSGGTQCGTPCEAYCSASTRICNTTAVTGLFGAYAQYASRADCVKICAAFPPGAMTDTTGNTLGCRAYHTGVALSTPPTAGHCWHGGSSGGTQCGTLCEGYCSLVMAACNATATSQFASTAACLAHCATYPVANTYNLAGTVAGNFLECRHYHAAVAMTNDYSYKVTHCPHAGLRGTLDTSAAVCGTVCDAYCNAALAACTGTNELYATRAACTTACANFATTGAFGSTTGNTLQCRLYHVGVALEGDAAAKTTHCPHAGQTPTSQCVGTVTGTSTGMTSSSSTGTTGSTTSTGASGAGTVTASLGLVAALAAVALAL